MSIDDETDDGGDNGNGYSAPAEFDPFATAIALCEIAQRAKPIATALKKLRKLGRDIDVAQRKLVALEAQAAQMSAALAEREAAIAARETALEARERESAVSIEEARNHLRGYYNDLTDMDRRIRRRIMVSADLLHGFNEKLQDLPSWDTIRSMVPGLPPDLPAAPPAEAAVREVTTDWTGQHTFIAGSSLTRSVPYGEN
jgi:hypothetical protein